MLPTLFSAAALGSLYRRPFRRECSNRAKALFSILTQKKQALKVFVRYRRIEPKARFHEDAFESTSARDRRGDTKSKRNGKNTSRPRFVPKFGEQVKYVRPIPLARLPSHTDRIFMHRDGPKLWLGIVGYGIYNSVSLFLFTLFQCHLPLLAADLIQHSLVPVSCH